MKRTRLFDVTVTGVEGNNGGKGAIMYYDVTYGDVTRHLRTDVQSQINVCNTYENLTKGGRTGSTDILDDNGNLIYVVNKYVTEVIEQMFSQSLIDNEKTKEEETKESDLADGEEDKENTEDDWKGKYTYLKNKVYNFINKANNALSRDDEIIAMNAFIDNILNDKNIKEDYPKYSGWIVNEDGTKAPIPSVLCASSLKNGHPLTKDDEEASAELRRQYSFIKYVSEYADDSDKRVTFEELLTLDVSDLEQLKDLMQASQDDLLIDMSKQIRDINNAIQRCKEIHSNFSDEDKEASDLANDEKIVKGIKRMIFLDNKLDKSDDEYKELNTLRSFLRKSFSNEIEICNEAYDREVQDQAERELCIQYSCIKNEEHDLDTDVTADDLMSLGLNSLKQLQQQMEQREKDLDIDMHRQINRIIYAINMKEDPMNYVK